MAPPEGDGRGRGRNATRDRKEGERRRVGWERERVAAPSLPRKGPQTLSTAGVAKEDLVQTSTCRLCKRGWRSPSAPHRSFDDPGLQEGQDRPWESVGLRPGPDPAQGVVYLRGPGLKGGVGLGISSKGNTDTDPPPPAVGDYPLGHPLPPSVVGVSRRLPRDGVEGGYGGKPEPSTFRSRRSTGTRSDCTPTPVCF